ncbi:MAG: hypothetical protein WCP67_07740 [Verrucomicrobiota bacterium]
MIARLFLALLATTVVLTVQAQTTSALGTKKPEAAAETAATGEKKPVAAGTVAAVEDESPVITPFRAANLPAAKNTRTFQLGKLNKPTATETTKELQRLFAAFTQQNVVDGSPTGFSKATGYVASINYTILQDLGDKRYLVKAAWPAAGPNDALAAGVDTMAVLLLERAVKTGETGRCTGMHVGTVSLLFTASFAPLAGKRLTLRREAFVECTTLDDSPAALPKFVDKILRGAEVSVTTNEVIPCKKCGGLGFTTEKVKGSLTEKHINCSVCDGAKSIVLPTETKIIP